MQTAEQLIASSVNLVTPPVIFARVKSLVDDQNSTSADLAQAIATDPAMSARVLKLVNSAFWGVRGGVDSLSHAVSLLGMNQIHDLVLASSVIGTFDRVRPELMDVTKFWRAGVFRSLAATALARKSGVSDVGRVFTQALMSDLGHMVLYIKTPELAAQAKMQTRDKPWERARAERSLIGCDFAQVGGALTDSWKLPQSFGEAIRHQNTPQDAGEHAQDASLLHIAALLAEGRSAEDGDVAFDTRIAPFAWQTIGLTPDCLSEIIYAVETDLAATSQMFGVPMGNTA
jgi:HD-like signal output (HDOD) protein